MATSVFGLVVLHVGEQLKPALVIEPDTATHHEAIAVRLRRAGFAIVSQERWAGGRPPLCAASLDVVGGDLIRIFTGTSSMFTGRVIPVSPLWSQAARRFRAAVALIPAGSGAGRPGDDEEALIASWPPLMAELAGQGKVLAGLASVKFDSYRGPTYRGTADR